MIEKAALVRKNGKVEQGTIRKRTNSYYYRLCQVRTKTEIMYWLVSWMTAIQRSYVVLWLTLRLI